ncbi:uncharacterized protein ACRADG_001570 [Cochliomyia hominivorax]
MNENKNFIGLICLLLGILGISALPLAENNALAEFFERVQLAAPNKESVLIKRRIYEHNNDDGELKQISLRSLIGDLEQNIFASASKGSKDVVEKEATNLDDTQAKEEITTVTESLLDESIVNSSVAVNSTDKVAQTNGAPTHIVIDRIAIQPHTGGISFIPIFELKRTREDENTNNSNHEVTKITISKTEITSLATATIPESSSSAPQISTSTASTTSTPEKTIKAAEAAAEVVTTPKNIEQLKEVEEDLKEKVAEIEAEPIILSARV